MPNHNEQTNSNCGLLIFRVVLVFVVWLASSKLAEQHKLTRKKPLARHLGAGRVCVFVRITNCYHKSPILGRGSLSTSPDACGQLAQPQELKV